MPNLADGRLGVDIGVKAGRIAAVEPQLKVEAKQEIDATGRLVTPPFVDAHFHMDATLSRGLPRINKSGTLFEGIQLWEELKPQLTPEAVAERAMAYFLPRRRMMKRSVRLLFRVRLPLVGLPHGVTGSRPPEVRPSPPPCG